MSVKSILDAEFSQMKSGNEKKKKGSKLSKVQEVKRAHQRHGLKKQRQKLLEERRTVSAPRRGNTAYWSHAPEPGHGGTKGEGERDAATVEENVRQLMAMSAATGAALAATSAAGSISQHHLASKRTYSPKCRLIADRMEGKLSSKWKKKQQENSTVFSDQDFEDFSKEYFGFSEPISSKTIQKKRKKQEDEEYH